jgi:hypothetical protein
VCIGQPVPRQEVEEVQTGRLVRDVVIARLDPGKAAHHTGNLATTDFDFCSAEAILGELRRIKLRTIPTHRLNHQRHAA